MISPAGILPVASDRTQLTWVPWLHGWRSVALALL